MSSIQQLKRDIYKYQNLDTKLRRVITELNYSADRLGRLNLEMGRVFQINGDDTYVSRKVNKIKKDIEETSHFLRSTVLPSIGTSADNARRLKNKMEAA